MMSYAFREQKERADFNILNLTIVNQFNRKTISLFSRLNYHRLSAYIYFHFDINKFD
jgi:hypothetical protein